MGILFVVATPIGNLKDISFRALETFKEADFIACEDTRHTLGLLTHYEISKPLISCRAVNEAAASEKIVKLLDEGKKIAYASDAGTPAISDPGSILVRMAADAGHEIVPIPGASAFGAIMSIAGSYDKTIVFEGFLSPKAGKRKRRLQELFDFGAGFVLYESPYRIVKLLTDIAEIDSNRRLIVGRELTKLHEEVIRGPANEVLQNFEQRASIKGEFSVFVTGK
ncbi:MULTISPECIES: 16S rRNA (cytidine(1402)-2'-O)-methyltransferase [unclassified Treponema]|uniref:16S rRNA (cytidine(1402)-2'-O)-methyltransferase n=1 Tax=unclassified Treponema TaxID=2638727 RepID=UPI0020A2AC3C|nr:MULTISPECIES: 16S rRNA (cytidine(1402)-2'-O)-methyltransferase [unclassified Treponema]UTC66750.1 16S rRNA (cytidine(1402)-2'-O)-methyltransferase [Treponema sp. OMZ 789]UTC69482.1 16S rRNA (cytidine(1402)-2'-O)-methyltransferase [Treponema sp. OMZ 790]UTC72196.1 16S rRNA (cytidine(1402)-2'-O)-methyltransferase [Treponema sp. OMZ 791]